MAEIPEILIISKQLDKELNGKVIKNVDIFQEKCLNIDINTFLKQIKNCKIQCAYNKGKWIIIGLSGNYSLLINVGMGGDILYHQDYIPSDKKIQCAIQFNDKSILTFRFWWFGHIHLLKNSELKNHKITKDIAIDPFNKEFTLSYFKEIIKSSKSRVKNILLDQKKIGGIGNAYIHDILFRSKIHPLQTANSLTDKQIDILYEQLKDYLNKVYKKGGLAYEKDIYNKRGKFTQSDFYVGYKEGGMCKNCQTKIIKIKTGSTSSYVCPHCQQV